MESGEKELKNKEKIKALLQTGQRISVRHVWITLRTSELRTYVTQLKRDGLNILSVWVTRGDNRFKEYWLAPEN